MIAQVKSNKIKKLFCDNKSKYELTIVDDGKNISVNILVEETNRRIKALDNLVNSYMLLYKTDSDTKSEFNIFDIVLGICFSTQYHNYFYSSIIKAEESQFLLENIDTLLECNVYLQSKSDIENCKKIKINTIENGLGDIALLKSNLKKHLEYSKKILQ